MRLAVVWLPCTNQNRVNCTSVSLRCVTGFWFTRCQPPVSTTTTKSLDNTQQSCIASLLGCYNLCLRRGYFSVFIVGLLHSDVPGCPDFVLLNCCSHPRRVNTHNRRSQRPIQPRSRTFSLRHLSAWLDTCVWGCRGALGPAVRSTGGPVSIPCLRERQTSQHLPPNTSSADLGHTLTLTDP